MSTSVSDILRRRRRTPMDERLPDGSSVDDLLRIVENRNVISGAGGEPLGQSQVLTPQNQQSITRPRTVTGTPRHPPLGPQPVRPANIPPNAHWDATGIGPDGGEWISGGQQPAQQSSPTETRPRAVTFDPQTGRPNESYYRERGDTAGLYEATRNWEPHGGKRGFKNSLKAALLMGAEGARANPNDPVTGALAGLAIGGAAGTAVPNFTNRLRRQQKLGQFGGELKQDLELKKQQAAIDQGQMVEVALDNGQRVMVPAKSAATLQSRQQEIGLRGDTLEARKKRWDSLGKHEGARDAQAFYNSGAADNSTELLIEVAKRMGFPEGTVLPPRGLGNQIKLDDAGNYIVISPRSGEVTVTGQKSYEPVKEAGRERRAQAAQAGAMARTQATQAGANQRAGARGTGTMKLDATTRNNIAKGVGAIESVKGELTQLDAQIKALDDATKGRQLTAEEQSRITSLGRQRQEKVNQAKAIAAQLDTLDPNSETGVGEGGYPYRKPRQQVASDLDNPIAPNAKGKYAGKRISKANVAEFGRRHGMTVEQATQYLQNEQAIIY